MKDPADERRIPDGYAYRYPDGFVRHNGGGMVNGGVPIESIPYYYARSVSVKESEAMLSRDNILRELSAVLKTARGGNVSISSSLILSIVTELQESRAIIEEAKPFLKALHSGERGNLGLLLERIQNLKDKT